MTRAPQSRNRPQTNPDQPRDSGSDPLRQLWLILAISAIAPLFALALCWRLGVPLGCEGRFDYLYSPVPRFRLMAVPWAALLGAIIAAGVWLTGAKQSTHWRAGRLVIIIGVLGLGLWSYFAPPFYFSQHIFNTHSAAHDGAFVDEALLIDDVRTYLHDFPTRARTPQEVMRGTRVISNPPGATLLAYLSATILRSAPGLEHQVTSPLAQVATGTSTRHEVAVGLVFFWLLIVLWLLSALIFYNVGRLFWPVTTAATYAILCVFTPATLLFTPGKDPAQLLTVALPLLLWLYAVRHGAAWAGILAGLAFLLAIVMSLVHVWIALIVLCATALSTLNSRAARHRTLLRGLLPATAGFVAGAILLYLAADFNLITSAWAVAASQAEVTRGPGAMPLAWQIVGIPLFLLFAGVGWWVAMLSTLGPSRPHATDTIVNDQNDARFGHYLLIATIVVLLGTVGFTNIETPRLWIPFVPLMILGGFLQWSAVHNPGRAVVRLLAALVFVHITCAALQWSLMDMREAETRITEQRYFD